MDTREVEWAWDGRALWWDVGGDVYRFTAEFVELTPYPRIPFVVFSVPHGERCGLFDDHA